MIILEVNLFNFMSYYSEKRFEFKPGINLVNGDNGTGKSILFEAIFWILSDQVYGGKESSIPTTEANSIIPSKKAIDQSGQKLIECYAEMIVDDGDEDIYTIKRSLKVKRDTQNRNKSSLQIKRTNKKSLLTILIDENEHDKCISSLVPPSLRKYMWFKGENVGAITNFNNPSALVEALNALSNIDEFRKIEAFVSLVKETIQRQVDTAKDRLVKDTEARNKLKQNKEKLEKDKLSLEITIQRYRQLIADLENRIREVVAIRGDAQDIKNLAIKIDDLTTEKANLIKELKENESSLIIKFFNQKWILKGTTHFFTEYSKNFAMIETEHTIQGQKDKLIFKLPRNIPLPIHVTNMLQEEKCFVCNRPALRDSDEWKYIQSLKLREENVESEEGLIKKDYYTDLRKLYETSLSLQDTIKNIEDNKQDSLKYIENLKIRIGVLKSTIDQSKLNIDELIRKTNIEKATATNIDAKFSELSNKRDQYREELERKIAELDKVKKDLENIEAKMDKQLVGSVDKGILHKKETINTLSKIVASTKKRIFEEILLKIEKESNRHLANMLQHFQLRVQPRIVIDKKTNGYIPVLYNEDGTIFEAPAQSLKDAKDLALIMSIVTSRIQSDLTTRFYPLVADAISSNVTSSLTKGFLESINSTFEQSIIIWKDFIDKPELQSWFYENQTLNKGSSYRISLLMDDLNSNTINDQKYIETIVTKE